MRLHIACHAFHSLCVQDTSDTSDTSLVVVILSIFDSGLVYSVCVNSVLCQYIYR